MKIASIPENEEKRLKALYSYKILDTAEEKVFNTIVYLAALICDVPISSVTLIDKNRQWFKASQGFEPGKKETSRDIAFCSHTILQNDFFEIKDATKDNRFVDNPGVTGSPHIVYYGGISLINSEGFHLGTLCVIDKKPRALTDIQKTQIKYLSEIAMALMEAKKHMAEQLNKREEIEKQLQNKLKDQKESYSNLKLLSQMNGMLESCLEREEAFSVIKNFCRQIFPNTKGFIYLMEKHNEYIELMCHWGVDSHKEEIFLQEDCWALRRGHIYSNENADPHLICHHIKIHKNVPLNYSCIPLMAQGEIIGLLTLIHEYNKHHPHILTKTQRLLCVAMGEQIALSLANIKLRQKLQYLSMTDSLTGLQNRRYLFEMFVREISKTLLKKTSMVLIILDIDFFKKFNDTFGHDAGDDVLINVARTLKSHVGSNDLVCRLGGEEFVVVLKDTTLKDALPTVENLRTVIQNLKLSYKDKKLDQVTISLGVSVFPDDARSLEELLKKADKALYHAKKLGRNQFVIYQNMPQNDPSLT